MSAGVGFLGLRPGQRVGSLITASKIFSMKFGLRSPIRLTGSGRPARIGAGAGSWVTNTGRLAAADLYAAARTGSCWPSGARGVVEDAEFAEKLAGLQARDGDRALRPILEKLDRAFKDLIGPLAVFALAINQFAVFVGFGDRSQRFRPRWQRGFCLPL